MKYIIYARKSSESEERQVLSIEAQLTELREFAAKEKLEIVASLCEAQTAKEPGRTKFAEMLSFLESGKAEGILSWHPDRLARNSIDGGRIIYLLDTGKIKDLKFPTFWFENTPQGKFMLQIAFGQSKYYVDNLSENIKRGIRQKLKNGLWPQMAPLGYLNDRNTKSIIVDKNKAKLIKKAFELYSTGNYSLRRLRETINNLGLLGRKQKTLGIANYQYFLKNPFYYGLIRYNNELYEGKHESIIAKKLFDKVQEIMESKSKPNKKKPKYFVFRGFIRCAECGCLITAETQKGHNYYHCTKRKTKCSQKYVREEELAKQINQYIQKVSLPDDWADKMINELKTEKETKAQTSRFFAQKVENEIQVIDEKLEKLMNAYLENALNLVEYREAKNKLVNQKQLLKDKLTAFEQKSNNRFELAAKFINSVKQAEIIALQENPERGRDFLKKIGSNFRLSGQKLFLISKIPSKSWQTPSPARSGARRKTRRV